MRCPYLLIPLLLATAAHGTNVIQCMSPDGAIHFTDTVCPADAQDQNYVESTPVQPYKAVPLKPSEEAQLAHLKRDLYTRKMKTQKQKRLLRARQKDEQTQNLERCEQAKLVIDQIKQQRRQGYTIGQAATLKRKEQRYLSQQRLNC